MIWTDNYGKKKERTGENICGKMWKTEDVTDKEKNLRIWQYREEKDNKTIQQRWVKQSQIYIRRTCLMVEQTKTK